MTAPVEPNLFKPLTPGWLDAVITQQEQKVMNAYGAYREAVGELNVLREARLLWLAQQMTTPGGTDGN